MLGRFETLNLELMRKMQNRTAPPADLAVATPSERAVTPIPGVALVTAAAASTAAGGGVKKKKPKKKK